LCIAESGVSVRAGNERVDVAAAAPVALVPVPVFADVVPDAVPVFPMFDRPMFDVPGEPMVEGEVDGNVGGVAPGAVDGVVDDGEPAVTLPCADVDCAETEPATAAAVANANATTNGLRVMFMAKLSLLSSGIARITTMWETPTPFTARHRSQSCAG
jgi:hypothetical protein